MNKIISGVLLTICSLHACAQQDAFAPHGSRHETTPPPRKRERPIFYLATSTGINNNTGIIGISADVPIVRAFSVEGGVGVSTWGYKLELSGKYYLSGDFRQGWALGAGVTHNTGLTNFNDNLEVAYGGTETVTLDLHPQTNVFFAAYKYWRLGRRDNRMFMELGWSVPVTGGDKYIETYGDPLSTTSDATVKLLSPGGLIAAFGFSFAIHQ